MHWLTKVAKAVVGAPERTSDPTARQEPQRSKVSKWSPWPRVSSEKGRASSEQSGGSKEPAKDGKQKSNPNATPPRPRPSYKNIPADRASPTGPSQPIEPTIAAEAPIAQPSAATSTNRSTIASSSIATVSTNASTSPGRQQLISSAKAPPSPSNQSYPPWRGKDSLPGLSETSGSNWHSASDDSGAANTEQAVAGALAGEQQKQQSPQPHSPRASALHWCDPVTGEPSLLQQVALKAADGYMPVQRLGAGSYGSVFLANCRATGRRVAVKYMEVHNERLLQMVQRETVNLAALRGHPHIVAFREMFLTQHGVGIVMDYMNGGALAQVLDRHGVLSEHGARKLFQQLVAAVDFMEQKGITNRDIKLENLLLDCPPDMEPQLKVCDFGLSKDTVRSSAPHTLVGSPMYIAPEVLMCVHQYDGHKADVWSCGVVLYYILHGRHPFEQSLQSTDTNANIPNAALQSYFKALMKHDYPLADHLTEDCRDLLNAMLQTTPDARPTIAEVMTHPWYNEGGDPSLGATIRQINKSMLTMEQPAHVQTADMIRGLCQATFPAED